MKVTFLGHSCFQLMHGGVTLLTDPFLTGNPTASQAAQDTQADYILVSHAHGDHVGDAVAIAKQNNATVITTVELMEQIFAPAGVNCAAGNIGGTLKFPFGRVSFFQALHSCGLPGGIACGFVLEFDGRTIYFAGDTGLMTDMTLLRPRDIDLALLPIGDVFTMGPDQALEAISMICPEVVIPMHYNTMPPICQDADDFARRVSAQGIARPRILRPGESLEF
jgi:L-ascorbate metabolism protein UlaG (beta-lactamase superfamily)